jgi:hypothetical protein
MANNNSSSSKPMAPGAKQALNNMKYETANELGISNYQGVDKGTLTSRQNGYVGGYMTKKLVQYAEEQLKNQTPHQ